MAAAVLLLGVFAAPFLVPMRSYLPDLTAAVSRRMGQPVSIADARLELLPTPRVALFGISVGKGAPLRIDALRVVPRLASLFGEDRSIRLVRADGVRMTEAALGMLDAMGQGKQGGAAVRVERVELRNVSFRQRILKIPRFNARIDLGPGEASVHAVVRTIDRALEARLDRDGPGAARVAIAGRGLRLPLRVAPLALDSFKASGTLYGGRLELPIVRGRLYGGTLVGGFELDWSKNWRLVGEADIAHLDLVPLLRDLGKPAKLSGRLYARAAFSARARSARQLGNVLVVNAPAQVKGGTWHGVDLARAAEMPLGKMDAGGDTPFEELRAKVALRGRTIRVEDICARSPNLVAGGRAEIAPDAALSGQLDVSVARTGGIVGVPLALGGTVSEPSLGLTRGAALGALLGTLLLPGVGTTLGATAVAKLESISDCR